MNGTVILKEENKVKKKKFDKIELLENISKKNTLLHIYTEKGWVSEVKKIVGKVDLDSRNPFGLTALEIAREKKHIEIIEIIENQIEINNKLLEAMKKEDLIKMCEMIEKSANINVRNHDGYSPVHLSIFWKNTKALEKLIEMNVDLNSIDEKGWTPLMIASNYGKIEHVKLLLKHNVKKDVRDNYGWTALELARDRIFNIGLQIQDELDVIIKKLNE